MDPSPHGFAGRQNQQRIESPDSVVFFRPVEGRCRVEGPRSGVTEPLCFGQIGFAAAPRFSASFTLRSPAILFADHAAPRRKTLGRMLLHPVGELRRAHQAGLHRNVSEIRGGDGLLVAICRRGETAEHGDDLDHDRRTPSLGWALAPLTE
jgi:hypothetical protein